MPTEERTKAAYFRNFIFGVEDSLVSTVGLLAGVAAGGVARDAIITAGVVLIFVEAFSMGVGSFLSERSAEEYLVDEAGGKVKENASARGGAIMFFSYFASGFVPLFPYTILPTQTAFWVSIGLSVAALLVLGAVSGRLSRSSVTKTALRMALLGGTAIALGVIVGTIFKVLV